MTTAALEAAAAAAALVAVPATIALIGIALFASDGCVRRELFFVEGRAQTIQHRYVCLTAGFAFSGFYRCEKVKR